MHYNLKERQRANTSRLVLKYACRPSIFRFCCSLLALSQREIQDETENTCCISLKYLLQNIVDMKNLRLIMNFNEDAARGCNHSFKKVVTEM